MSTNQTRTPLSILLLCCCTGLNGLAFAEPTTVPVDADRAAAEAAALGRDEVLPRRPGMAADTGGGAPSPSNTIQMLLELQATPEASASASESGRRAVVRPKAPTVAPNPFGNGENPFGSSPGTTRAATSTTSPASPPMSIDWQTGVGGAALGGSPLVAGGVGVRPPDVFPAPAPRGASRDDGVEQRWWMPMALIRWVREHRQEVLIGAAVALGLAWAGSSYSQRRR